MDKENQNKQVEPVLTRRGFPVYRENPSLVSSIPTRIVAQSPKKVDDAYMVSPGTGEVVSQGAFAFVEEKNVDSEQFVKVYLDGIKQYGELSKAGAMLFEFVYRKISGRGGKDKDTVMLNYQLALDWKPNLARATFFRGMKELLEKEFLYRSIGADNYFVNVRFMFNGDRMVLVKSYRRNQSNNHDLQGNKLDQLKIGNDNE